MSDEILPIGTQLSRLAPDPDAPAVSCDGRTLTRGELDSDTNRLARAYAELGVGPGDYVTIALPNSIEWVQACVAVWKLGAIPQPLSARLPDAEFAALLDLRPRALLVGRADPRGPGAVRRRRLRQPGTVRRAAARGGVAGMEVVASGGSTGRPKLIEAGGRPHPRRRTRWGCVTCPPTPTWCRCR
jgi:bile acid-coenzyme A ligase